MLSIVSSCKVRVRAGSNFRVCGAKICGSCVEASLRRISRVGRVFGRCEERPLTSS